MIDFSALWANQFEFWAGIIPGALSILLLLPVRYPRLQWWNWVASATTSIAYVYLFYEWGLYGNMLVQIPFALFSIQGAWRWRGQLRGVFDVPEIPITNISAHRFWLSIWTAAVGVIPLYYILRASGDSAPFWDGWIFALSFVGILMQVRKKVEMWYVWIAVDLIAVPLHLSQDHPATAFLYFFYLVFCFVGWKKWREDASRNRMNHVVSDQLSLKPAA